MIDRRAYGYSYKIWWSYEKENYTARALGVNVPDVSHPTKELTIIAMENELREYRLNSDVDLFPLLKMARLPNLADIGPVAKARGITDVSQFWALVERVQKLWREAHDYEADWDLP